MDLQDILKFTRSLVSSRQRHATFDMKQKEAAKWGFAAVSGYAMSG